VIDVKLSDEDIERIAQRVTDLLARKLLGRLAKFAGGLVANDAEGAPIGDTSRVAKVERRANVQPTAQDFADVAARRARRGC